LCAGDGQVVVFTTNHIDMLDPELLTPDLMNMHIHMPYCTISAFNQIAFNHFNISHHILFEEIEGLIKKVGVTLAEISGELLKSSDAEVSLQGLIKFLHNKIAEYDKFKA
jgi:chaperone BCS1